MARTYRDKLTVTLREMREFGDNLPVGAYPDQFGVGSELRNFQRHKGGNMVMAPSVCGEWSDDRADKGTHRKRQRRQYKRRERAAWRAELTAMDPITGRQ